MRAKSMPLARRGASRCEIPDTVSNIDADIVLTKDCFDFNQFL